MYTSKEIQNEMIRIHGTKFWLQFARLILFSYIEDEATDSADSEQLSIGDCYLEDGVVQEAMGSLVSGHRQLDLQLLRGQVYGAGAKAGKARGVAACIK